MDLVDRQPSFSQRHLHGPWIMDHMKFTFFRTLFDLRYFFPPSKPPRIPLTVSAGFCPGWNPGMSFCFCSWTNACVSGENFGCLNVPVTSTGIIMSPVLFANTVRM